MSKELAYSCAAHLLNRQDYKEEVIEDCQPWLELTQHCHEILLYPISKDFRSNISNKCKYVNEVEFTYQFIHPAIAQTYKYTYSENLSVSYLGNKNSLFIKGLANGKLSNTKKQIILIGIISALKYLESKGVSHYCLDVNHIIFDKLQFPKLVCSGIPTAFRPQNWDDKKSAIQSFGKFAQTILSNQSKIPAPIQTLVDNCINNRSNDLPTFDEILDTLSNESNYLDGVESNTISQYIEWLDFQDKFPCNYFFELDPIQRENLHRAVEKRFQAEEKKIEAISKKLYNGEGGYPKDLLGALYFAVDCYGINVPKSFLKYYGFPDWLQNLNSHIKELYHELDEDGDKVEYNPNSEFLVEEGKNRSKLESTENSDIKFVINSYLKGSGGFPKSEQAAFFHVKKLLKKEENNPLLLTELGKMYENGIGTPINYQKAIKCFEKVANFDQEAKQFMQQAQAKQKELEKQISNLPEECKAKLEKANSNNFRKTMYVAFSFLHGLNGFPKSQFHAYLYYKKAAEIDPYVYCMLGNLFRTGIGFPQNIHKAAKLYKLSNLNGCLRGRFYDGFMQLRNFYPPRSTRKQLKYLDKFFFDYKNQQGKSNAFNYCRMIHVSQLHFPIFLSFYIDAESTFYGHSQAEGVDQRRQNDSTYIKQSIWSMSDVDNDVDDDDDSDDDDKKKTLNDTEVQITMWFTLYQLKLLIDNGILLKDMEPEAELFKDSYYYFAITDIGSIRFRHRNRTIQHVLYKKFKKSIPERLKESIKKQVKKDMTVEEILSYYENNLVSNKVDKDEFESFIRKCKSFVPLDSAKILVSEKVDRAESGHKESLQECARNYFFGHDSFPINYREAFKYYEILANDNFNDSNAQMWLGTMLSKGIGVKQDIQESLKWFKKASDQGDVKAQLTYALFLEYYNRKLKDPADPNIPYLKLLFKSADALDPQSLFEMGKLKESHVSWEYGRTKSVKYYLKASQLGHIESTRRLFHVYKKLGMNNEQNSLLPFLKTINDPKYIYIYAKAHYDQGDYENSIKYTKIMLPSKNPKFRKLYADHLLYGRGIEKDTDTAKKFYIAATKKYPKAVVALANIYAKGIDCEQDLVKARKIYLEAIRCASYSNGLESACQKLYSDFCEKHKYFKSAFNFQNKIAKDKKNKEAQYKVAMSLLCPEHNECKKDIKRGIAFLTMSADQNYPIAAYELGKSYIYGKYKQKRNFEKGVEYLKVASNLNYTMATFLLGKIYHRGIGTIPDDELAKDFFTKAASKDHPGAKYYLSLNDRIDFIKRRNYLIKSAEQGYPDAQFRYGVDLLESALDQEDEDYQTGIEYIQKAARQNNKKAKAYLDKLTTSSKKS